MLWYNLGMAPKLTPEMRRALTEHPGQPIYVLDTDAKTKYVLFPYDDSEPDPDEFLPLVKEACADQWNASGMEVYDDGAHKPTP